MESKSENKNETDKEIRKLTTWAKSLLPDQWEMLEIDKLYDSNLSYPDNKDKIREQAKKLLINDNNDKHDNKLVGVNPKRNIDTYYSDLTRAIGKVCEGYSNMAFVRGNGGIGKSYNIRKTLHLHGIDYTEISGDVTEAYLYRLLFENNGKVIWFKDMSKLLKSVGNLNMLKAATETEEDRVLTKSNYSRQQDDLPDSFNFTGRFIFDYNALTGSLKKDFEALTTRGDFVDINLSPNDIADIMRSIAQTDKQAEVTEFLINNKGLNTLNLRTQHKAFKTREWAEKNNLDWKSEIKNELKNSVSNTRKMLYALIGSEEVRTKELKKMLVYNSIVNTARTADRRISDWLELEELFKLSNEDKNFLVGLYPRKY